jgi:hypothetical protein
MVAVDDPAKIPAGQGDVQLQESLPPASALAATPTPAPAVRTETATERPRLLRPTGTDAPVPPPPPAATLPVVFRVIGADISRGTDQVLFLGTAENISGRAVRDAVVTVQFQDKWGSLLKAGSAFLTPSTILDKAQVSFSVNITWGNPEQVRKAIPTFSGE